MKYYLMAPGPSTIPERVLLEMAKPIIHHRTQRFEAVLGKVRAQLKQIFQTQSDVLLFSSVGSGAMEASITNFFSPGDQVIAVVSGKFGERWADQAVVFGLDVVRYEIEWGKAVDLNRLRELLEKHPSAKAVLCQACETSTGVSHPIKEMGQLIKSRSNTLFMVDAITAMGIYDIKTDEWGLDVVISGSQKAFMLPPGLSMMSVSQKAWEFNKVSKLPKFYFNAKEEAKAQSKNTTHFTPAISIIQGLSISLDMMLEEGLPRLFKRHARLAKATRESVKEMGLELWAALPSDSITAVKTPSGIDGEKIVSHMAQKYNVTIIGGQDQLKGKIFRLGHMGYTGEFDVLAMIGATEMTLKDLGHNLTLGKGVARALQVLHQELKS
ncbi:MAG: alanine--glyoxylate aminotransferase family protein [Oligoflexia bacterium]|nr:alanine--glyoxylate aminotransferase family protein [Oligoflexia bacterium]